MDLRQIRRNTLCAQQNGLATLAPLKRGAVMFAKVVRFITTGAAVLGVCVTLQAPAQAQVVKSTYINVGDRTLVPFGWLEFCNRYQGECASAAAPQVADIDLTAANYKKITQVNRWVNASIVARSDQEQWGVVDRWDYPTTGQ